jgi:hypothetical protein
MARPSALMMSNVGAERGRRAVARRLPDSGTTVPQVRISQACLSNFAPVLTAVSAGLPEESGAPLTLMPGRYFSHLILVAVGGTNAFWA